jgi:hypothetical protein
VGLHRRGRPGRLSGLQFKAWKDAHVNSSYNRGPHKGIPGKSLVHQLAAMTSDRETIADLP